MFLYGLLRACRFLWQRLPLQVGYGLASLIADITYLLWKERRANTIANMTHVLGREAGRDAIERAARQSLRNYLKYLVELLRFPRMGQEEIERSVIFRGWEHIDRALEAGKGLIFVGLHMGNWDMAAAALCLRQYPFNVIAETLKPERLNRLVQGMRLEKGMKVIPMERAPRGVLRALHRNEILGLLIDRPSEDGVVVRFFDTLTRVPAGTAKLALKTGAQVAPAALVRLPNNSFLAIVDRCIAFRPSGEFQRDVQALTQLIMDSLERMVSVYPDQWYMFRRMWVLSEQEATRT